MRLLPSIALVLLLELALASCAPATTFVVDDVSSLQKTLACPADAGP